MAVASDNTRDPFYAYGDLDMLEVFREATRILHLDHPAPDWVRAVAATPADLMGLDRHGRLEAGDPADLVLIRARSWNELLRRPQTDRIVLLARTPDRHDGLPDYRELDALMRRLHGPDEPMTARYDIAALKRASTASARRTIRRSCARRAATSTGIRRSSSASSTTSRPTSS